MWLLLLYPWQWTPADALDPDSSDGLISMHGWGPELFPDWSCQLLAWSSGSPLQKTQLAACPPPIMLTPAEFHMTGLVLQDPETTLLYSECQCQNVSLNHMQSKTSKSTNKRRFFLDIWPCYTNWQYLMSSHFLWSLRVFHYFPCHFASHAFWKGAKTSAYKKKKFSLQTRQLSLLPCHLILHCLCPSPPAQIKRNLF